MTHPGLPLHWALVILLLIAVFTLHALLSPPPQQVPGWSFSLVRIPLIGRLFRFLTAHLWPLFFLKILFVALFLLIIIAGLWGSPIPERNIATVLTWNLWWAGIVVAVFFLGSSWCAVCPWDTIANWLVRHRLWRSGTSGSQLQLAVPKYLRSLWPALALLLALTWLELGVGVTVNPYATALLALLMVVLATLGLVLYEGKAFCRTICPVGRTIGVYSQLAPIALRPIKSELCASCTTLDCYHGSQEIAACPTNLVMGRLQESTYCLSCGNCTQSCPQQNIAWQLRSPSVEALQDARPHNDEAFFMLGLMALTSFHGLTMLPYWQTLMSTLAQWIGESGQLLLSFSIGLLVSIVVPMVFYWVLIRWTCSLLGSDNKKQDLASLFSGFAFVSLPLAFSYHLAHNLNHLVRESSDLSALFANPLGVDALPLSMMEMHERHLQMIVPQELLFALQAVLIAIGFCLATLVIRYRGYRLFEARGLQLIPMLIFAITVTLCNLWMMMQAMQMRM